MQSGYGGVLRSVKSFVAQFQATLHELPSLECHRLNHMPLRC
jgi:hypothetical protein